MSEFNKGDIVSVVEGEHTGEWGVITDVEHGGFESVEVDTGEGRILYVHPACLKMIEKFESYEEKLERVLRIADYSESTDALILSAEIYRLRKELASYEEDYMRVHEKITRVELIDNTGRAYTCYNAENVVTSVQDQGRTLKVFLNVEEEE